VNNHPQANDQDRRISMLTVKEKVSEIVQAQPDDSSFDEILRELAFSRMVERGLVDSRLGRTIPNEEMEHHIRTW
jgi:predicted transcriptional regulator